MLHRPRDRATSCARPRCDAPPTRDFAGALRRADGRARGDRRDQAPVAVEGRARARPRPRRHGQGLRGGRRGARCRCSPTGRTSAARSPTCTAARAATALPVLRKDFTIDEVQVYETRAIGADAMLLIVAALPDDALCATCTSSPVGSGSAVLVEAHDDAELDRALALGAADRRRERPRPRDVRRGPRRRGERLAARIPRRRRSRWPRARSAAPPTPPAMAARRVRRRARRRGARARRRSRRAGRARCVAPTVARARGTRDPIRPRQPTRSRPRGSTCCPICPSRCSRRCTRAPRSRSAPTTSRRCSRWASSRRRCRPTPWIDIPGEVLDILRLWRPTPLVRADAARASARHAGAHLLQGRVGVARGFAQAEHRGAAGVLQQGRGHHRGSRPRPAPGSGGPRCRSRARSSTSSARSTWCGASYEQKPYRRVLMETWGARGRAVAGRRPDHPGLARPRDQRRGARRRRPRRHALLARLGAQPRAAAPDRHRPRGEGAARARRRDAARRRDRRRAAAARTSAASRCRS